MAIRWRPIYLFTYVSKHLCPFLSPILWLVLLTAKRLYSYVYLLFESTGVNSWFTAMTFFKIAGFCCVNSTGGLLVAHSRPGKYSCCLCLRVYKLNGTEEKNQFIKTDISCLCTYPRCLIMTALNSSRRTPNWELSYWKKIQSTSNSKHISQSLYPPSINIYFSFFPVWGWGWGRAVCRQPNH